jgi:heme/copper-type cytochrome/quinol oxidase subunit 2
MLLILAVDGTAASGTRTILLVLLVIAILLILVGAILVIVTMYFYWKARSNKAETAAGSDTLSRE